MPVPPLITAYVALGANLGDRRANIESALASLRATPGIRVTQVSSFLDNPAVGGPAGSPPFLNAAAELRTTLAPRELLEALLDIERRHGRERQEKWGPRTIDLDLLLYGDRVIDEHPPDRPHLRVPHPLMHQRRFVLDPLKEIASEAVHPVLNKRIAEL